MAEGNGKALTPLAEIKQQLFAPEATAQFRMALPAHIPVERFQRIALTAITNNPDLMRADRRSLFNSCVRAAQDGLLPDGREAALVLFKDTAQYMPMVAGILKKVRNSGELATISAHVVYSGDKFTYRLGDTEELIHEPPPLDKPRGEAVGVYAIATLKNGEKVREILTKPEVEKIRAVSRAKNAGPWVTWWEEMARKTAIRRLSKRLPMSTDRDDELRKVIEADDDMVDLDAVTVQSPAARVQALLTEDVEDSGADPLRTPGEGAGGSEVVPEPSAADHDAVTGEVIEPAVAFRFLSMKGGVMTFATAAEMREKIVAMLAGVKPETREALRTKNAPILAEIAAAGWRDDMLAIGEALEGAT